MPTLIFSVIPDVVPAVPGDIILRTFSNRSAVSALTYLAVDQDIVLAPAFVNVSTFGPTTRLTDDVEFNIILAAAFSNVSTFGPDTELQVAPPDEIIVLNTAFVNESVFRTSPGPPGESELELIVAPPDEVILLDDYTNVSTFGAATFLEIVLPDDGGIDDHDAIIGYHPIGGVPA